jgi:hypothetical protein
MVAFIVYEQEWWRDLIINNNQPINQSSHMSTWLIGGL